MPENAFPFFDNFSISSRLSKEAKKFLADHSFFQKLKKKEILWDAGDPGDYCALIINGFMEILRPAGLDREICMGVFGPGDLMGLSAVTQKSKYPGKAVALNEGALLLKIYLKSALRTPTPLLHELTSWSMEATIVHEQILRDKIDFLSAGSVSLKFFECLLQLERRFGKNLENGFIEIPIALTRLQIARIIDTTVETLIRTVKKWEKQNLIKWSKKSIQFKPNAIRSYIKF